ncbi:MAG: DUF3641 domain-containing protein [Opitutales bacterium]|nr:DUF3641 domain-containing protein [Opitutales bacterium]
MRSTTSASRTSTSVLSAAHCYGCTTGNGSSCGGAVVAFA